MPSFFSKIKNKLQQLSFRTGVIITLCCIPFYILSFAQMTLDIDVKTKGILWVVLFGQKHRGVFQIKYYICDE